MTTKCAAAVLKGDIVSRTAADARAANPGKWANDSRVPKHLYMCLADIFGVSAADWPGYVLVKSGDDMSEVMGIDLAYASSESVEAQQEGSRMSDTDGAAFALMRVLCRVNHPAPLDPEITETAYLRVIYLLDYDKRIKYRVPTQVPDARLESLDIDNTVDPDEKVTCYFRKDLNVANVLEMAALFSLEWTRVFAR